MQEWRYFKANWWRILGYLITGIALYLGVHLLGLYAGLLLVIRVLPSLSEVVAAFVVTFLAGVGGIVTVILLTERLLALWGLKRPQKGDKP